jgi:hypothetical protein
MNAYFAIYSQETDANNLEKYDVEVRGKNDNKMNNWKNSGKYNLFRDEIEALKNDKNLVSRKRDSRYSLKNRRTVNKDWKDFNNEQM